MKLNKKSREEIRNYLIKELETVQVGVEKIKIPKETLETLLFEINPQTKAKQLVFSGPFLKKIDLSEVSFDNVDWNTEEYKDLSYTNAKIDFRKSFNQVAISNINLEGVDLSNSYFPIFQQIYDCNIYDTKAKINFDNLVHLKFANLSGLDLSQYEISLNDYIYKFWRTNFCNTGIKIKTSNKDLETWKNYHEYLVHRIDDGDLTNCYINSVRIKSKEEQEKNKNAKREEYEEMKEGLKKSLAKQIKLIKLKYNN